MFRIGRIINTHGIDGELKVQQITDFTELFTSGQIVYIKLNNKVKELVIEKHRPHQHHHLIRFEGFESIDDVEHLKGLDLKIKEEQLPILGEREYHYNEIIDCIMYTTDNDEIGKVVNILSPGANDVWVVENDEGKEYLIPFIDDVVKTIDVDNKKVTIELMEGLLD